MIAAIDARKRTDQSTVRKDLALVTPGEFIRYRIHIQQKKDW